MEAATVLARAIHFAATLSLLGIFVFLAVVAEPVLDRARLADATAFRRTLRRVAWASLVVALLSGTLWLVLEARSSVWSRASTLASPPSTRWPPWSVMVTVLNAGSSSWVNHMLMTAGGWRTVLPTAGLA